MKLSRIVLTYMFKYFCGFLAVFFCSVAVSATAKRSIEEYIVERARTYAETGIQSIGEAVEKMDLIRQLMIKESNFHDLAGRVSDVPRREVIALTASNQMLQEFGYMADYIPYMFALFRENDFFVSNGQCSLDFKNYYSNFLQVELAEAEGGADSFKKYLFENAGNNTHFLKIDSMLFYCSGKQDQMRDAILYLGNRTQTEFSPQYLLCFVMDQRELVQYIFMPEIAESSFLYVEDLNTGKELTSYGDVPENTGSFADGSIVGEDGRYFTIVNTDNDMGWKIVAGVPEAYLKGQMKAVDVLIALYLWGGLLAVLLLTLCYSLGRYKGFRKVLATFPQGDVRPSKIGQFSDYELLSDGVKRLKERGADYYRQLGELKLQNQAILLESLMVGGIRTIQEQEAFLAYFGRMPEFYCVAVVQMAPGAEESFEEITLSMQSFLRAANIRIWGSVHSGALNELFLIECLPDQETNAAGLADIFKKMSAEMTARYGITFHTGISTVGMKPENVSRCYEQARGIVQAQYAFENENMVETYEAANSALAENPVTPELLGRLYGMLICGQQEAVCAELDRMAGIYRRMPYYFESNKEQVFYTIRNIYSCVLLQLQVSEKDGRLPVYGPDLTCVEMAEGFRKSTDVICGYIVRRKRSKNEKMKEDILLYLNTHFSDAGLSAFTVSQEFGISEKYLFQFIREQTGETFASLLLHIRLEMAKRYLEQSDYSNEQIAELAGFGSPNTFYRNFKKATGMTPNVYKDSLGAKEERAEGR